MSSTVAGEQPAKSGLPSVVVGVDGSEASKDALIWAANYAHLIGGEVRAIAVWEWPVSMGTALPLPDDYSPFDDAESSLSKSVATALGDSPEVVIHTEVAEGSPSYALVEASKEAVLLVVGSRGHGGFTGLLLGSTSEHCARHAACPVVVVRHQPIEDQK
jgi:nucleotide-binding universal stress UspA family protein